MSSNVEKFFELYESDWALRDRLDAAEAEYPGSLEIRSAVCEHVLLPVAEELGLPFTIQELKLYELRLKALRYRDVPMSEEEMADTGDGKRFWLLEQGWEFVRPEELEEHT